jgi:DNA-binding response OmpR family regulator
MAPGERETVLVVDDDPDIVETYAAWLEDDYAVRTAEDGSAAIETIDDTVDVVLLDRRMGDVSGDEVLEHIGDADYDCRVAMVTGVEPDVDVIGMGFDAYLVKPVSRADLVGTVENLIDRRDYREDTMRLFSLLSQKSVLESEHPVSELEDQDEYRDLLDEIATLRRRTGQFLDDMTDVDFRAELRDLGDED